MPFAGRRIARALAATVLVGLSAVTLDAQTAALAPNPPMGWNSWDAYGLTIDEAQYRANVKAMVSKLKPAGYRYAVIDEGWYLTNPKKAKAEAFNYVIDAYGRYQPASNRFASAGTTAGFKPLADEVHAQGLKFGIHIIRGIPKDAVSKNTAVAASSFHARDVADTADLCPWNPDNFGVRDNAAGQAWYDSLFDQYARWGVDYVKVDCIAAHPYKGDEIRMIHRAIAKATGKTHRPMVLSLSPGPAPLDKSAEVASLAQLWRISDDVWDLWQREPGKNFPQGVRNQFEVIASWTPHVKPGNWPDADMLPVGTLGPVPGQGSPRKTRLTEDEQRTLLTLWGIARSPLIAGANLTELDEFTTSLLTNKDVIRVNQTALASRQVSREADVVVWAADLKDGSHAVAIFNVGDSAVNVMTKPYAQYGLTKGKAHRVRDAWSGKDLGMQDALPDQTIAPHGCVLWILSR